KNVKGNKENLSEKSLAEVQRVIKYVADTLGLVNENPESVLKVLADASQDVSHIGVDAAWIESLIEERKTSKASKNWARADEIRKELAAKNIVLKDNPDGTTSWSVQS